MKPASHRILVVDDSATIRAFIVSTLEDAGFEALTAKSGFEALKVLAKDHFDLIITDINMPDINGLELVRFVRLKSSHPKTPLLIVSTDGRERDRDRGLQLGANAYLVKPFAPESLLKTANALLSSAK